MVKEQKCWKCGFFSETSKIYSFPECRLLGHPLQNGYAMRYHSERCGRDKRYNTHYYDNLGQLIRNYCKGEKILILGTHVDFDIRHVSGEDVTIIEPEKQFAQWYKKKLKAKVVVQDWEIGSKGKYDTVLCLDCIEHSRNAKMILDNITEVTDRILLCVPNGIFKTGTKDDHGHGPHVSFHTESSLRKYFERRGFEMWCTGIKNFWFIKIGLFIVAKRR